MTKLDPVVTGTFQLKESENFEPFMKSLGVGYLTRQLGNRSKPLVIVEQDQQSGAITFTQKSLVSTSSFTCHIGKPFDEKTADGRHVKSTMTLNAPNVLVHEMKGTGAGKDSVCVREFFDKTMKCVCKVDDIETTRIYERKS